jgi:CheY-like chemotaxis protein
MEQADTLYDKPEEPNITNLKILVAEDDELSYAFLTRCLRKINKEILHAVTGVEAVDECRNNPDIDLILMDIHMPYMNGYEATRQIRQFNKNVVIIAQTAYGLTGDREKSIKSGCNDYISKPINKENLLMIIQKFFDQKLN